jgi:hypothetical protein
MNENVQLGDIDNSSTVGTGYSDFTASTTNLTIGAENTITLHNLDRTNLFRRICCLD